MDIKQTVDNLISAAQETGYYQGVQKHAVLTDEQKAEYNRLNLEAISVRRYWQAVILTTLDEVRRCNPKMDWLAVFKEFLLHNVTSETFDEIEQIVNTPQNWDNVGRIMDWRNYVSEKYWDAASPERRAVLWLGAQVDVGKEEWD